MSAPAAAPEPEAVVKCKALEKDAVAAAEAGDLDAALAKIDEAIALVPTRSSLYNNRAQVLRLKGEPKDALPDLDKSVSMGEQWLKDNPDADAALIAATKSTLERALTQRSVVHQLSCGVAVGACCSCLPFTRFFLSLRVCAAPWATPIFVMPT